MKEMHGRSPKFERLGIIIGAMKCATTSLFDCLAQHPEVAASRNKEPEFFCADDPNGQMRLDYEDLFTFDPSRHKIALEASTRYTKFPASPGIAERMANAPYDIRLVYVVRQPVTRYVSQYLMHLAKGWSTPDIRVELSPHLLAVSSYAFQLKQFAAHFKREQIHIVRFEDLAKAPQGELQRINEHLRIDASMPLTFKHLHKSQKAYFEPALKAIAEKAQIPGSTYLPIANKENGMVDFRGTIIPSDAAQKIHDALRDDMHELSETWGVDVKTWGF